MKLARGFSWQHGINQFAALRLLPITSRGNVSTDLPMETPYRLRPGQPKPGWSTLLRPLITQTLHQWYRNIDLFPITYAFRPRLRDRLTLGGLTLPRKP